MSFHSFDQAAFDGWKRGLDHSCHKPEWDQHDGAIQRALGAFRLFNQGKSGYIGPAFNLIKAVLWVETGAFQPPWKTQPMQIGWKTDPGIFDVLTNSRIGLFTPTDLRRGFSIPAIKNVAEVNIQAGLALLHLKMAFSDNDRKFRRWASGVPLSTR